VPEEKRGREEEGEEEDIFVFHDVGGGMGCVTARMSMHFV
jgi:hypothetical protein